jgi:hypothetical protein
MDPDRALEVEAHLEARTLGGRTTVDPGNADRARTGQSTVEAVCSPAAKHNRAHHSAKLAGSLRVAQYLPLVELAVECHTGKAQQEGAELPRLDIAAARLARER